jgi:hypothetical protein
MIRPAPKAVAIKPTASRGKPAPPPRKHHNKLIIERGIAAEVEHTGIARTDFLLLKPEERNRRLNERLRTLKVLLPGQKIPERTLRHFFNGR